MHSFDQMKCPLERTQVAPDGSEVRLLLVLAAGGMAHFKLPPGETSRATMHRTVEEIWYFLNGRGAMWREQEGRAEIVEVSPPYDVADITALLGGRVVMEVLATLVSEGKLGKARETETPPASGEQAEQAENEKVENS